MATQEMAAARLRVSADVTDVIQVVLAQASAACFPPKGGFLLRMRQIVSFVKREKTLVGDGMAAGYREKSRTTTAPLQ